MIGWYRTTGSLYSNAFELWVSSVVSPRGPEQNEWRNDYVLIENRSGHLAMSYEASFATRRIKSAVFRFYSMSADPARPRLNRIKAMADQSFYGETWLSSPTLIELFTLMLTDANIPAGAIISSIGSVAAPDGATEGGLGWSIIADLCEYASCRIFCRKDSKIDIAPTTLFTASTFTPVRTWTKDNASSIEPVWGNAEGKSQVALTWKTADGLTGGVEKFPSTLDIYGTVEEVGPYIYASATPAQAAARRRFYQARYPYTLVVECAYDEPDIYPGEIHRVQWKIDDTSGEMNRIYIVTAVDHLLEASEWKTVITMSEIGREGE